MFAFESSRSVVGDRKRRELATSTTRDTPACSVRWGGAAHSRFRLTDILM
jgi:hypothetical protein